MGNCHLFFEVKWKIKFKLAHEAAYHQHEFMEPFILACLISGSQSNISSDTGKEFGSP